MVLFAFCDCDFTFSLFQKSKAAKRRNLLPSFRTVRARDSEHENRKVEEYEPDHTDQIITSEPPGRSSYLE